jgi:predicted nucleic acid-binding protein
MQNSYVHFRLLPGDADDNKFVDCAIASNAELIVTNDKDFNPLKNIPWPKVEIMNIKDFVRLITQ